MKCRRRLISSANSSLTRRARRTDCGRLLVVHARRGEGQHLPVHAVFVEHAFAEVEVAVAGDEDVVVARVMQPRIAVAVVVDPDLEAGPLLTASR